MPPVRSLLLQVGAPAAEVADIASAFKPGGFANEAGFPATIGQLHFAQAERCRNTGQERAQFGARQLPDFNGNRYACSATLTMPGLNGGPLASA